MMIVRNIQTIIGIGWLLRKNVSDASHIISLAAGEHEKDYKVYGLYRYNAKKNYSVNSLNVMPSSVSDI